MTNLQVLIHQFHWAFRHPTFKTDEIIKSTRGNHILPAVPNEALLADAQIAGLRLKLLREEIAEGHAGYRDLGDDTKDSTAAFVELVDAIGDVLVLALGTGCVYHLVLDTPSYDISETVTKLIEERRHNGSQVIFRLLDEEVNNLEQTLYMTVGAPKKVLLFASAISRSLQNIVNWCFAHASLNNYCLESILREIHRSNMSKLGANGKPIYREDGKILKGENYSPPDILGVLNAAFS